MNEHDADTWILGAFGCGVFKQDPQEVARIFHQYLTERPVKAKKVIFAIPSKKNRSNRNYEAFCREFGRADEREPEA